MLDPFWYRNLPHILCIDKENLEIAVAKLSNENNSLDDKLDELTVKFESTEKILHDSREKIEIQKENINDIELKQNFLIDQLYKINLNVSQKDNLIKEKDDNLMILEEIVKTKDVEITRLQTEIDAIPTPNIHSCEQCDFSTESEKGLKIHMSRMHEVKCSDCDEKFAGETRLKSHMCRIHIENPDSEYLYMKNWFIKDTCIQVFGKEEEKNVALLHCKHCTEIEYCSEFPPGLKTRVRQDDESGLIHLYSNLYLKKTKIDCGFMVNHIYEASPDDP